MAGVAGMGYIAVKCASGQLRGIYGTHQNLRHASIPNIVISREE
jgi:hypothetical protein